MAGPTEHGTDGSLRELAKHGEEPTVVTNSIIVAMLISVAAVVSHSVTGIRRVNAPVQFASVVRSSSVYYSGVVAITEAADYKSGAARLRMDAYVQAHVL